jgi:hypothetical protein
MASSQNVASNFSTGDINAFVMTHDPTSNTLSFSNSAATWMTMDMATGNVTFIGNVNVTGSISKGSGTFKIDDPLDPENKYLYHSFVESPDMMNIYNGNITTDANGYAKVQLPEYFEALNTDFRYQLTVVGTFEQAIVAEKEHNNQFVIRTDKPNVEVSWQITGIRNDKYAQAHRVVPVVDKEPQNKGKYLHPVENGKPASAGIGVGAPLVNPKQ